MTPYTPAMLAAFWKTVAAYREAIELLEMGGSGGAWHVREEWREKNYGAFFCCRMCKACGASETKGCLGCVLQPYPDVLSEGGPRPCGESTFNFLEAVVNGDVEAEPSVLRSITIAAFRSRLAWLLKRAADNGVVMGELTKEPT